MNRSFKSKLFPFDETLGGEESNDILASNAALIIVKWLARKRLLRKQKFFAAAEYGLFMILEKCLQNGQNPNERNANDSHDLSRTALCYSAGFGHPEIVRLLLDANADALISDKKGNNALHYASQNSPAYLDKIMDAKMGAGAGGNQWKQNYVTGDAPQGCLEVVRVLLRRQPRTVEAVNEEGQTPLHLAASHGLHTVVNVLICEGDADVSVTDKMNRCPLHLSAWRGDTEVTRVLLEHAENSQELITKNKIGRTPLHVAAVYGHTRVARQLIESGAPLDVINNNGNTPLHLSMLDGFWETAELLVEHGAETHLPNCNGESPVWIAADRNQTDLLQKMLEKKRIVTTTVGLFGYDTKVTYDMRGLDSHPILHRVHAGMHIPDVGEVHPTSQRAIAAKAVAEEKMKVKKPVKHPSWGSDPIKSPQNGDILSGNWASIAPTGSGNLKSSSSNHSGYSPVPTPSTTKAILMHAWDKLNINLLSKTDSTASPEVPVLKRAGSARHPSHSLEQTALQRIAANNNTELISHPIIIRLLEWKWNKFAKRAFAWSIFYQICLTIVWTIATLIGKGPSVTLPTGSVGFDAHKDPMGRGGMIQVVFMWIALGMMVYMAIRLIRIELTAIIIETKSKLALGSEKSLLQGIIRTIKTKHDFWFVYDLVIFIPGTIIILFTQIQLFVPAESCTICWELSRVCYGLVSVLLWGRYMQFFSAHRTTGPFVKVIAVMLQKDLTNFFSIYSVILLAFSHGFFILLSDLVIYDPNDSNSTEAFYNPIITVLSFFRLMIGDFQNLFERYQNLESNTVLIVATVLYVCYQILATILMMNLLIAMLDETWSAHKREMEKDWRLQWAKRILNIEDQAGGRIAVVPDSIAIEDNQVAAELAQAAPCNEVQERLAELEETQFQMHNLLKSIADRLERAEDERALLMMRTAAKAPSIAQESAKNRERPPSAARSKRSVTSSVLRERKNSFSTKYTGHIVDMRARTASDGSSTPRSLPQVMKEERLLNSRVLDLRRDGSIKTPTNKNKGKVVLEILDEQDSSILSKHSSGNSLEDQLTKPKSPAPAVVKPLTNENLARYLEQIQHSDRNSEEGSRSVHKSRKDPVEEDHEQDVVIDNDDGSSSDDVDGVVTSENVVTMHTNDDIDSILPGTLQHMNAGSFLHHK